MDRKELLKILNKSTAKNNSSNDLFKILTDYCLEKGKQQKDIDLWLSPWVSSTLFMVEPIKEYYIECLEIALKYFKNKFSIYELRKPHNEGYEAILYY